MFFLTLIITMGLEFFLLICGWPLPSIIAAHMTVVGITLFVAYVIWMRDGDVRFFLFLSMLTAITGPVGPVLSLMAYLLYLLYKRSSVSIKDLLEAILPHTKTDPTRLLYEKILHGLYEFDPDYNPLPFLDVMSFGTEKQKRLAIEKILRFFRPEFSPALKKALNDPQNSIRVLAATATATLDRLYYEKYHLLEKLYQDNPKSMKATLSYAEHCDEYSRSQVLDPERVMRMINNSIEAYNHALTLDPKCFISVPALCRLYNQSGQSHLAKVTFERAKSEGVEIPFEAYKWYMSALYDLKEFQELRKFASSIFSLSEKKDVSMELKELILSWSGTKIGVSYV